MKEGKVSERHSCHHSYCRSKQSHTIPCGNHYWQKDWTGDIVILVLLEYCKIITSSFAIGLHHRRWKQISYLKDFLRLNEYSVFISSQNSLGMVTALLILLSSLDFQDGVMLSRMCQSCRQELSQAEYLKEGWSRIIHLTKAAKSLLQRI